ncbi:MAG: hydrogenase expression/formation protein HypE [Verrucomicrobiales bacterium]|nr:hydrogenase expression/formation protein HypE [Verrucomicrobiales bacterium]
MSRLRHALHTGAPVGGHHGLLRRRLRRLSSLPQPRTTDVSASREPVCPVPLRDYPRVLMAHGGGGRLMHELVNRMFGAVFTNPILDRRHDAAVLPASPHRLAFTTDSYVVHPLFFPGGDLGSMAVHGTVNDLAMSGARPQYLSAGFILEEGLPMETLWRLVVSMGAAARNAGVSIVTGDTKVVDPGKGDGVYVNTTGLGVLEHALQIEPQSVAEGDAILISGDVGRHGMAVMAVREGLSFESAIESDSCPLWEPVQALITAGIAVHCLRDLTRGGLAATLNEIAEASGKRLEVQETRIPVRDDVRAACGMLGLDPTHVACEGRFVAFVPEAEVERALSLLRRTSAGSGACRLGAVAPGDRGEVILRGTLGVDRLLAMPSGQPLPRIC